MTKTISIELRCTDCGDPLVFEHPGDPPQDQPHPMIAIQVQPCSTCVLKLAEAKYRAVNPGWANVAWITYEGSCHDRNKKEG